MRSKAAHNNMPFLLFSMLSGEYFFIVSSVNRTKLNKKKKKNIY